MSKIKVSQDYLYEYLIEHNVTISRLPQLMGVSDGAVYGCFRHTPDRFGRPMRFSPAITEKLNTALPTLAAQIQQATITFGSDQTFTNSWGRTYDPAAREAVLAVGKYFKLTPFLERVLGWKKGKRDMILVSRKSRVFGQVSQEDVNRINAELLSVASVLSSWEVVIDEGCSVSESESESNSNSESSSESSSESYNDNTLNTNAARKTMESSFEAPKYGWDDTGLSLPQRSALLRERWPNGMLLFRVSGGYIAEGEDANAVHDLLDDVQPYTDPENGVTIAWISNEQISQVLPRLIFQGRRFAITDMYKE